MRRLLSALVLAFASMSFSPAQAGGLLQDLFAPAPRVAPTVMYYAPPQPQIRFLYDPGLRVSRRPAAHRKAIVKKHQIRRWAVGRKSAPNVAGRVRHLRSSEAGRVRRAHVAKSHVRLAKFVSAPVPVVRAVAKVEAPERIDNDPTLRVGDAYMTPEGLRIYRGPNANAKERKVFVDFRRSELAKGVKSELAALVGAGHDYRARRIGPPPLKTTVARASTRKSVDRRGRVIRVIEP